MRAEVIYHAIDARPDGGRYRLHHARTAHFPGRRRPLCHRVYPCYRTAAAAESIPATVPGTGTGRMHRRRGTRVCPAAWGPGNGAGRECGSRGGTRRRRSRDPAVVARGPAVQSTDRGRSRGPGLGARHPGAGRVRRTAAGVGGGNLSAPRPHPGGGGRHRPGVAGHGTHRGGRRLVGRVPNRPGVGRPGGRPPPGAAAGRPRMGYGGGDPSRAALLRLAGKRRLRRGR